ncbi:MAG: caspase family protein, partial [Anaerolineae bacterium]
MAPASITTTGGVRRSLHIAVDKYRHAGPFLPNLAGCENDIRAMRQLLTSRFGFEERNAVLLINEQATRQAITAAWHGLTEQTQAGDTVFIQYSGHGSQMRDVHGDEEDGMDETILPHDTRDPGRQVFDITDDEIKEWVDALLAKTDNVVLLFDCCHSASATRQVGAPTVPTRRADPD